MKTVSPALVDLLRSRDPVAAFDLYQFTLPGDTVLYYGTVDVPLFYNDASYGGSVRWDRSEIDLKAGLEADSLTVKAYATPADLVNGVPFHQFLRQGGFDNAYLLLQRAYYPAPGGWFQGGWFTPPGWFLAGLAMGPPTGVVWLFSGLVTEVITGGLTAQIKIDSHLYTLDRKIPRNLYQHFCNHVLYGQGCGLNGAAYAVAGQAQAGSTLFQIVTNLTGYAAGYFNLGKSPVHLRSPGRDLDRHPVPGGRRRRGQCACDLHPDAAAPGRAIPGRRLHRVARLRPGAQHLPEQV